MNTNFNSITNKRDESELNDSINNNQFQQQLAQNYEQLKDAFKKIDKNSDEIISQQELLEFLDSNMPNGRLFDRNTFKKIFQLLDSDQNGSISM